MTFSDWAWSTPASIKPETSQRENFITFPPYLLGRRHMVAAIPLVAGLVRVRADRLFLTVADGPDLVRGQPLLHVEIPQAGGSTITQTQVVFGRAALVAMPFDHHGESRVLREDALQEFGVGRGRP